MHEQIGSGSFRVVYRAEQPAERYPDALSMLMAWHQAIGSGGLVPAPAETSVIGTGLERAPVDQLRTARDLGEIENPYKGLRAFGEADVVDFFGRAALVQRLLDRMADEDPSARFLAVVGPSGSGKSSVVRAGLAPALRRGGLPDSEHWFVVEMLPGAHPLEELEAALLRVAVDPPPGLLAQLQSDTGGLARAVEHILPDDAKSELVLVIDQFEELFTLTLDETIRTQFIDNLCAACEPHSRLWDVVTGQELRRFVGHADTVTSVAYSADGHSILTGSADKTARLWHADIQAVVQLVCAQLPRDLSSEERTTYNIHDDMPTCPNGAAATLKGAT